MKKVGVVLLAGLIALAALFFLHQPRKDFLQGDAQEDNASNLECRGPCQPAPEDKSGKKPAKKKPKTGWWRVARTSDKDKVLSRLEALGYLKGYVHATSRQGVTAYDKKLAYDGVNLYSSAHAPQAYLMDMEGNILHNWSHDLRSLWPDAKGRQTTIWRRAYLLENGDILAIHSYIGLIKLDRDSNLLWAHRGSEHHDIDVDDKGNVYVLTRRRRRNPRFPRTSILDDLITVFSPNGRLVKNYSVYDLLNNSEYSRLLKKIGKSGLLPAGIILTGGGSGVATIEDLARASLKLPSG